MFLGREGSVVAKDERRSRVKAGELLQDMYHMLRRAATAHPHGQAACAR
jgi:hypothetical protein